MRHLVYLSFFGATLSLAACATTQTSSAPSPIGPETLNVADAAIAGGDPEMALSVTQSVLQTDPTNPDALIHEGDAYYALSRCPGAMAAYQLALKSDPKSSPAETGMARCLLKTDPASAESALELAIQDDPGNAAALNDLGIARDLQGNFAGAVAPYQQALIADPQLTAAEVNLGLSLALSGNGPEALQYLGPLATSQSATPKIREDYAAALVASGRDDEARHVLSVDLTPDQVDSAMDGFSAVIAGAQAPLSDSLPPPTPAMPAVQTASVAATPLMPEMAATPPPASAAPPPSYAPNDSTSAYTGPSPVANAVSSSTPGPAGTSPAASAPPVGIPDPAPAQAGFHAYSVQLASLNSQADAQREWSEISGANPSLFADKQPDIENAIVNGRSFYRLRTGVFNNKADAAKFCGQVSAAGNTCTLVNF